MSRWSDRVAQSDATQQLEALEGEISELGKSSPEDQLPELERLKRLVGTARARLVETDPDLVTTYVLNQLSAPVQETRNLVAQQQANLGSGGAVDLVAINDQADNILDELSWAPPLAPSEDSKLIREGSHQVGEAAVEIVGQLRTEADAVKSQLDESRNESQQAIQQRDTEIAALTQRVQELQETIDEQRGRLDQAINDQGTRFDESQNTHNTEFAAELERQRQALSSRIEELDSAAKEQAAADQERAREVIAKLEEDLKKAEKTLGAIARSGNASGYQQQANEERATADRYRKYTLWFGAGSAVALIVAVFWAGADFEPERLVAKLALSAALAGLAGYTARQSHNHRAEERRSQNLGLALASIGPYLSGLDDDRRQQVLEAFTFYFFAPRSVEDGEEPGPSNASSFLAYIEKARSGS